MELLLSIKDDNLFKNIFHLKFKSMFTSTKCHWRHGVHSGPFGKGIARPTPAIWREPPFQQDEHG